MMGRLKRDQGQFFYSFCLDEIVPADHRGAADAGEGRDAMMLPRSLRALRPSSPCSALSNNVPTYGTYLSERTQDAKRLHLHKVRGDDRLSQQSGAGGRHDMVADVMACHRRANLELAGNAGGAGRVSRHRL
jgi:hypothetical protein